MDIKSKRRSTNEIFCCIWNSNSIYNKKHSLIDFLKTYNIGIMIVTDTRLTDTDQFKLRNYTTHRRDRTEFAGGVAIMVKNTIPHSKLSIPDCELEAVGITIIGNTNIIAAYRHPKRKLRTTDLDALLSCGNNCLLGGDFNAKHTSWGCDKANASGTTLMNYCTNNNCVVEYPPTPTHYPPNGTTPSTIDIAINKNITNITHMRSLPEMDSDHNPVLFTLTHITPECRTRKMLDYSKANWTEFRKILQQKLQISEVTTINTLEEQTQRLTRTIQHATRTCIPLTDTAPNDHLPAHIKDNIRERNKLRKLWQQTRAREDRQKLNRLIKQIRIDINQHTNKVWNDKLTSFKIHDNNIWKLVRNLKKNTSLIPAIKTSTTTALSCDDISAALADQFVSVHNEEHNLTKEQEKFANNVDNFLSGISLETVLDSTLQTDLKEIKIIIKHLKTKKSTRR